jgi:hypothetical protein
MLKVKFFHLGAAIALFSTAVTVASPKAAQAFSFSVEAPGVTSTTRANATVIDFSTVSNGAVPTVPTTLATSPTNGGVTIANTDAPAIYTAAFPVFSSGGGGGRYLAVGSGFEASQEGVVRLDFDAPRGLGYFGLFWGSPGSNDSITFVLRNAAGATNNVTYNAAQIFGNSFTGLNAVADTTGNIFNLTVRLGRYVNFFSTNDGPNANKVIQSVLLEDSGTGSFTRSFQVDNIAYEAIPTPALLPGLLGLGASLWNKRRKQATLG